MDASYFRQFIFTNMKYLATHLNEEEVDSEGRQTPGQLDVLALRVDLRGASQLFVLGQNLLLDLVRLHVRLGQEFLQAGKENDQMMQTRSLVDQERETGTRLNGRDKKWAWLRKRGC